MSKGKVYALSDIHGQRALWNQIKAYLAPDDTLYFLGDAADRGPAGYEIMKELLMDSRVIYLKGNHETLMRDGIKDILHFGGEWAGRDFDQWVLYNGGYPTCEAWADAGSNYGWIRQLSILPIRATYVNKYGTNIYLSHAGFNPTEELEDKEYQFTWDRTHITRPLPKNILNTNFIVVHGHTPSPMLECDLDEKRRTACWCGLSENPWIYTDIEGACFYGQGHKICIDTGAYCTGRAILLDLDEMDVIPFDAEIEE